MPRHSELVGTFTGERHVFDNGPENRVIIGGIKDEKGQEQTIKGDAAEGEFSRGITYRFFGQWRDNPRYGRQFWFVSAVAQEPATREGVVAYLCQCEGIGPASAHVLFEEFGPDAVKKLREEPEAAAKVVPRLSKEKAKAAAAMLKQKHGRERVTVDLLGLLDGRGFPKKTIDRAIRKWHLAAPQMIRRNPYLLMSLPGCGFLKCDKFYLDLRLPAGSLKRQALCAWHAIAKDSDGSTWHPRTKIEAVLREKIAGADVDTARAIELAVRAGLLSICEHKGRHWLAERRKAENERLVADAVRDALEETANGQHECLWPDVKTLDGISEHQREQIAAATGGIIGVLRGSPGTGKTYSAAALIKAILPKYGRESVVVAAPTGKAAVRLTEALDGAGVSLGVATIHRTLKVQTSEDGGFSFYHGENEPLPQKFVIVDESSMIDTDLMASLLRARAAGTHILFVGDPYQLPPVGHGRPFLDLMTGGVPTGELTEIRRNSGRIVEACASIRDRKTFEPSPDIDTETGENLGVMERATPDQQLEKLDGLLEHFRDSGELSPGVAIDPIWDVQILVAVNKRSELNRKDLNARLQLLLNGGGERLNGHPFRVGDKVVCLKNGWYAEEEGGQPGKASGRFGRQSITVNFSKPANDGVQRNNEGKVFVANGELAEVAAISHGRSVMRLTAPDRLIVVPHGASKVVKASDDGNGVVKNSGGNVLQMESRDDAEDEGGQGGAAGDWDLGYALSVHKSQGSDWPIVLVMIDDSGSGRRVSTRNWLYTAISRAKKLCLLIGKKRTALDFCTRDGIAFRKTFLAERLQGEELVVPKVCREKEVEIAIPSIALTEQEMCDLFAPV